MEATLPGPDPSAIFILGGTNRLINTSDQSVPWHSGLGTHINCTTLRSVITQVSKTCCGNEVTAKTFENNYKRTIVATIIEQMGSGHHF